jgi:cobalt-zinc-cadmium efflux system membrane fusion protein
MRVKNGKIVLGLLGAALLGAGLIAFGESAAPNGGAPAKPADPDSISISAEQAKQVKVVPVQTHAFAPKRDAVGYIDFDEDRTVQVFTQYPGRVRQILVKAGDDVRKGQVLFTIDSPDLVQAESTLISSHGLLELSTKALERLKKMVEVQAAAQKDLDQAISDQKTAEANYNAARDAVRIFEKADADIDKIVETRKVEGELVVRSPIAGRITARNVAPGLLLQPGNTPAPITVADISVMWLIANLQEADIPLVHKGAPVSVSVLAYPGRSFSGQVTYLGESVDPNTHRIAVRSEIRDPKHELRQQMMATFVFRTGSAVSSAAIPQSGLVREGDGTMSIFATEDGLKFKRVHVHTGMQQDDLVQILDGVNPGQKVAGDGALFLSNALALQSQ